MAKFYRSEDKTVLLEVFGAGSSIENLKSLKANTTDAAVEKHLPVVTQEEIMCYNQIIKEGSKLS